MSQTGTHLESFNHTWSVEILKNPALIAPARQFIYPQQIAGEEEALSRGALQLTVTPPSGGTFLATCALGFTDRSMPSGVFACPNPDEICAVAGGYAYLIDTMRPEICTHLAMKPVVEVRSLSAHRLLLFVGFHSIMAWGTDGLVWESARLSWEGIHITGLEGDTLRGTGWNLMTDREVEFSINLSTGQHLGGGFAGPAPQQRS